MVSRIKQLLDWKQLSPTQFADRIGIGRPVISHILSERNKPSLDVVQRILTAFPELSTDWLIKGEGEMLAASEASVPLAPTTPPEPEALPVATAPVVPAAPFRPAMAPVQQPIASVTPSIVPVVAPPAAEPVVQAPAPKPAPRPTIARFSPSKASAKSASPLAEPVTPAAQAPVVEAAGPVPQPTDEPATSQALADEPPTQAPVPTLEAALPAPAPLAGPSLADVFGEPGKAIRRIVIFYRDGSFADYQPEG